MDDGRAVTLLESIEPLLVCYVRATHLLASLGFLREKAASILKVERKSPKDAIKLLFKELLESANENKWDQFYEALQVAEFNSVYTYFMALDVKERDLEQYSNVVRVLAPELASKTLLMDSFLNSLRYYGVISETTKEKIKGENEIEGEMSAAILLLSNIASTSDIWCHNVIDSLRELKRKDLILAICPDEVESDEDNNSEQLEILITDVYRPLILDLVNPTEIFPYIHNFIDVSVVDILKQQESVSMNEILDKMSASAEPGKWRGFVNALKRTEYEYLYNILTDDHQERTEWNEYRQLLKVFCADLKEVLNPMNIVDYLYSHLCLSLDDKEYIYYINESKGSSVATLVLLDRVHRKSPCWFRHFLDALFKNGQKEIVRKIHPDYFAKLPGVSDEVSYMDQDSGTTLRSLNNVSFENANNFSIMPDRDSMETGKFLISEENILFPDVEKSSWNLGKNICTLKDDSENTSAAVKSEILRLRSYQNELAEAAIQGKNCIICAPTGSGKTYVALKIMQEHLQNTDRIQKVVYLVNQVVLAEQQAYLCKKYLSAYKTYMICGSTQNDMKVPLGEILQRYSIIVMTAQILVDAFGNDEMKSRSFSEFSLVVFDECHHTTKNHPYSQLMASYLNEKFSTAGKTTKRKLPQIVGLTASLGVGKARNEKEAVDHILSLCANLDCEELCTVNRYRSDLMQYVNNPEEDLIQVEGRKNDLFVTEIRQLMSKLEDVLKCKIAKVSDFPPTTVPTNQGSVQYTQWLSQLKRPIAKINIPEVRKCIVSCSFYLDIYNESLIINSDCRTKDGLNYIEKKFNDRNLSDLEKELYKLWKAKKPCLEQITEDSRNLNPKLDALKNVIIKANREKSDIRCIVFVKTRALVTAMVEWMLETPELKIMNASKLVGTGASFSLGGMTQNQQLDVLHHFKNGTHKILVATVGEEGLDIKKCNLVVSYNHVTNEIARVQKRGRARAEDSQYVVIADTGSILEKEDKNSIKENMMNCAIHQLQEFKENNYQEFSLRIQKLQDDTKFMQNMNKRKRARQNLQTGEFMLRCYKCDEFACFNTDLRTINDTHHCVVPEEFDEVIHIIKHSNPSFIGECFKINKIYCKKCSYDWGIQCLYKKVLFSVIKICSFVIVDEQEHRTICLKWKDAPFSVQKLTIEDIIQKLQDKVDNI